ncbi:hypothetical protein Tco_1108967 [Tanacetum coccineum]
MASFDYRLNPLYAIKECSSCGTLYTGDCGCSKGGLEDKILVPVPDLSQRPLKIENFCLDCGDPVHGLYCRQCALIRKTLEEVFQDFQDTSESSDDDINFVNKNQEPFVVKQDPGVNSSQSPPQIDHECCYECGDSLDGIFCQRCTYLQSINEELAEFINTLNWNFPTSSYDDDDDEYSFATQEYLMTYSTAITPESPVTNSLIMEDDHLDTIPETESDELIKSSVEDLVQIPSESEDSSDGECDLPPYDDSSKNHDLTFSNPLFDIDEDFTSRIEYPCFNAESDLLESLLHQYTSINDSQKIDSLLGEFVGELTLLHSIPPGIDDVNLDPEGDILFLESLLYDNSSPCPPEEFNYENPTESFSPSPIPVKDYDSLIEEINIFLDGNGSIPPGIESDDYDSEDDDNSTSRPEFESFHVDYPDSGDSTIDVVEDIPVDVPNIFLSPVIDTLLSFSSENEDKVFNHGILASKEKSHSSSSHRGVKASKTFHYKSPMLIHGDNTPSLGVRHPHFYPP